jgi:hypothetical protein
LGGGVDLGEWDVCGRLGGCAGGGVDRFGGHVAGV